MPGATDVPRYSPEEWEIIKNRAGLTDQQVENLKLINPDTNENPDYMSAGFDAAPPPSVEPPPPVEPVKQIAPIVAHEDPVQTLDASGTATEPIRPAMYNATDKPNVVLANEKIGTKPEVPVVPSNPLDEAYGLQEAGLLEAAKIGQKKAAEESAYRQEALAQNSKRAAEDAVIKANDDAYYNNKTAELNTELERVASLKVDPDKYWANKSTGEKILAGLGMLFGAVGAGGENKAATVVRDAIDKDIKLQQGEIENQKSGLAAKRSLLSDMRARFKDDEVARLATRSAMFNNAILQGEAKLARYGGPEMAAKAAIGLGQLRKDKAITDGQIMAQWQKNSPVTQQALNNPELMTDEQRKRAVPGFGLAQTEADAKELKAYAADYNKAKGGVADLLEISHTPLKSVSPSLREKADTIAAMLEGALRTQVLGPGTVNDSERALLKKLVANPTAIFSVDANTRTRLETLASTLDKNLSGTLKAYGVQTPEDRVAQQEQKAGIVKTSASK